MMRIPLHLHAALVFLLLGAALIVKEGDTAAQVRGAAPQGAQTATPKRNLQVLPANTPQDEILQVMQDFTAALGVDCAYCHAQAPALGGRGGRGRGGAAFDYVSDEKPQKKAARAMMMMVRDLNTSIATAVGRPAPETASVGCITCHRGVAVPMQLADVLDHAVKERGTADAVTTYRDLRRKYFGAQAYDFSERSLITYADRALRAGRPDEATTWLELNLSYFPRSALTYAALSNAKQQKKDVAGAIADLERAVALEPENTQLQRQLEQLRAMPK